MARMNFTENYTRDSVLSFLIKSGFEITEGTKNTDRIELTQPVYKTDLIVNYVHNPSFLVAINGIQVGLEISDIYTYNNDLYVDYYAEGLPLVIHSHTQVSHRNI